MRQLMILFAFVACTSETTGTIDADIEACGPSPVGDEPGFAVTAGTYPGQGHPLGVCIADQQYVDRDAWISDLRDWAICVEIAQAK